MTKQPDIIWLVADQLHHRAVGYAGNPVVKTPNIDRLAAEGLVFENAYCQQPLCMPSRSSFNTGYYPQETHVHSNPVRLPDCVPTVAERLRKAGYHTAAFGHIGGDGLGCRFDEKVDWWDAPLRQSMMGECDAVLPGNERFPAHRCGVHPVPKEKLFDTVATDLAVDAIDRQPGDSPLFLQLDFYGPHIPWFAPHEYLDLYRREDIPLPKSWNDEVADKPTSLKGARVSTRMEGVTEDKMRESLHHYYARISMIDDQIGRVLRALEKRGNMDNAVIMFFADHGDYAGEFGMIGKNRFMYDCLAHVPLVISGPGHVTGKPGRCRTPAGLIDLAPTTLELAGMSIPNDLQGESLLQVAKADDYERPVFASYLNGPRKPIPFDHEWDYKNLQPGPFDPFGSGTCWGDSCIMVRSGDYKLIMYRSGALELFNLDDDPGEQNDLSEDPDYGAVMHRLMIRLLQWQMSMGLSEEKQPGLPYHFRSFVKRRLPKAQQKEWDRWQHRTTEREGM